METTVVLSFVHIKLLRTVGLEGSREKNFGVGRGKGSCGETQSAPRSALERMVEL